MLHHGIVVQRRAGRQGTANSLHTQARDVEWDENKGVQVGADARQGRVEREADVFERQVDGDADEGWAEDDGDDLGLEGMLVPGVVGERDARGVAWGCCQSPVVMEPLFPPFLHDEPPSLIH
jgi:hypothetical protein